MPMRAVTVRRWEVAAAFVVLTVAYVVAVLIATHASNHAGAAATEAKSAVNANLRTQARLRSIRVDQLRDICEYANEQNRRIVDYLVHNTRQGEARRAAAEAVFPQITNCDEFANRGEPIQEAHP